MSEFDSKDFGERIKNYRIKRAVSTKLFCKEQQINLFFIVIFVLHVLSSYWKAKT